MTTIDTNKVKAIALNKLILSPDNARKKMSMKGIPELAASILSQGVLQNVVVQKSAKDGVFEITAGGRRHAALKLLLKQKKIAADHPVNCVMKDEEDATEVSLAENFEREDMHPADKIMAFGKMHNEQQISHEDIAAKFGISHMTVRRYVALSNLSPRIIGAFRDDKFSLEQLRAVALTSDHAKQEAIMFEPEQAWMTQPYHIKSLLTKDHVSATEPVARFVGLKAYEKAGGIIERDLFEDQDKGRCINGDLLNQLAMDKLNKAAEPIKGDGWKWVRAELEYRHWNAQRLHPELADMKAKDRKRYDKLEKLVDALDADEDEENYDAIEAKRDQAVADMEELESLYRAFTTAQKALSGVIVSIDHAGKLRIDHGLVDPADAKAALKIATTKDGQPVAVNVEDLPDQGKGYSSAVTEDLTRYRTASLAGAVAANAGVALRMLAFTLVQQVVWDMRGVVTRSVKVSASPVRHAPSAEDSGNTVALYAFEQLRVSLASELPKTRGALWQWLLACSQEKLEQVLAYCTAATLDTIHHAAFNGGYQMADDAGLFAEALSFDMAAQWKPSLDFFKRVPKSIAIEALTGKGFNETQVKGLEKAKKAEAAELAAGLLKDSKWLPAPIAGFQPFDVENEDGDGETDEPPFDVDGEDADERMAA